MSVLIKYLSSGRRPTCFERKMGNSSKAGGGSKEIVVVGNGGMTTSAVKVCAVVKKFRGKGRYGPKKKFTLPRGENGKEIRRGQEVIG